MVKKELIEAMDLDTPALKGLRSTDYDEDADLYTNDAVHSSISDDGYQTGSHLSPHTSTSGTHPSLSTAELDCADALQRLGSSTRDMIRAINNLSKLGVEAEIDQLPRIAVVGNQSAGKSSLIEAISEIKVPRYSGTCTRVSENKWLSRSYSNDG
jgi:ABC-type glutathione transport system ATPase component